MTLAMLNRFHSDFNFLGILGQENEKTDMPTRVSLVLGPTPRRWKTT